jgi:hypothetical protein
MRRCVLGVAVAGALTATAASGAVLRVADPSVNGGRPFTMYYTQCRFADGAKAILMNDTPTGETPALDYRTPDSNFVGSLHKTPTGQMELLFRTKKPDGGLQWKPLADADINRAYRRAIDYLRGQPPVTVNNDNIRAVLATQDVPACPWPKFY